MARLLLTGATGFVGAATLRAALAAGHEVAVLLRPGRPAGRIAPYTGLFSRFDADLRNGDAVSAALSSYRPDAVIHAAWSGVANTVRNDPSQISDNIAASCGLVTAAADGGCRSFIAFGSQGEYGPLDKAIAEDELPRPTTLYGASKLAAFHLSAQLAAQRGLRFAWLRLFSTYGPDDNEGWLIPLLIRDMLAGRRPRVTLGTQKWDWLYIDDVAAAVMAVLESEASGVFNLGSGRPVAVRRAIELIRDFAAPDMQLVFGEVPFRPDQVMHMQADNARLRAATGWAPRMAFEDGIAHTVAWYRRKAALEAGDESETSRHAP